MGRAFSTAIGIAKAALLMLHNSEWPNQEIRIGDALGNLFQIAPVDHSAAVCFAD